MNRKPIGLSVPYRKSATSMSSTPPKALKRQWVELTDDEAIKLIEDESLGRGELIDEVNRILKERNT